MVQTLRRYNPLYLSCRRGEGAPQRQSMAVLEKQELRTLHDMATCALAYHSSVDGDGVCGMLYLAPPIDLYRTIDGHVRRASPRL